VNRFPAVDPWQRHPLRRRRAPSLPPRRCQRRITSAIASSSFLSRRAKMLFSLRLNILSSCSPLRPAPHCLHRRILRRRDPHQTCPVSNNNPGNRLPAASIARPVVSDSGSVHHNANPAPAPARLASCTKSRTGPVSPFVTTGGRLPVPRLRRTTSISLEANFRHHWRPAKPCQCSSRWRNLSSAVAPARLQSLLLRTTSGVCAYDSPPALIVRIVHACCLRKPLGRAVLHKRPRAPDACCCIPYP